jgi:hypothetical protein
MLTEQIRKTLEHILEDIKEEIESKGFTASGRTANSFEIVAEENYGLLIGLKSFQTIVAERYSDRGKGRKPTQAEGNGELFIAIRQWIEDKGIATGDDEEDTRMAWAITKFIHKNGTSLYREGREGVNLKGIVQKRISEMLKDIGVVFLNAQRFKDYAIDNNSTT